jgi:hypothetical protein
VAAFPSHTLETAPEGSRATLAAVTQARGFPSKPHAKLAESPPALDACDAPFGMVAAKATPTPVETQAACQAMNALNG